MTDHPKTWPPDNSHENQQCTVIIDKISKDGKLIRWVGLSNLAQVEMPKLHAMEGLICLAIPNMVVALTKVIAMFAMEYGNIFPN